MCKELNPELNLNSLAAYCQCEIQSKIDDKVWSQDTNGLKETTPGSSQKTKKYYKSKFNLKIKADRLENVLNHILLSPTLIIVHGKRKAERMSNSRRRSTFIGVSRNGPNWQSMISVDKQKFYIGTYRTEREAAIAFDFYSMMAHGPNARTNFSYSKDSIKNMISNYRLNKNVFIPEEAS